MTINDVDSLVHVLESLSWYGIPFLILTVLSIFIFVTNRACGILSITGRSEMRVYAVSSLIVLVSVLALKFGVNEDQETIAQANAVKSVSLLYYTDFVPIQELIEFHHFPSESSFYENLVKRFPNSFSYSWLGKEKAIMVIDKETHSQLHKNITYIIPAIRSELVNILSKDSVKSFEELRVDYDSRMSYTVLEQVIAKYPMDFQEIAIQRQGLPFSNLKRIR